MRKLFDALRGARHIALFAALALAALAALLLMGGAGETGGGRTALERRLERILGQIDGVGSVHAMVVEDASGRPSGAVIVCEGMEEMRPWLDIQSAVQALLNVDAGRIKIIGKNGFGGAAT